MAYRNKRSLRQLISALPPSVWLFLIVLYGAAVRFYFLSGYALGDDLTYVSYADSIVHGTYPDLELRNQYAYRPLLLYAMAAGIKWFGLNEFGIVAPFYFTSVFSIIVVYALAKFFLDSKTALLAAFLFATYPFNLIGSTTIHNDILIGFFLHLGFLFLFLSDRRSTAGQTFSSYVLASTAGIMFVLSFLVKISMFSALLATSFYSLSFFYSRKRYPWNHLAFYGSFALGLVFISMVYLNLTGDFFWQYKAEFSYYDYRINAEPELYSPTMDRDWGFYLKNLFSSTTYAYPFNEHGGYYWLLLVAVIALAQWGELSTVAFFLWWIVFHLLFLEFYPIQVEPFLVPLPRQSRYLELISISVPIIISAAFIKLRYKKPLFLGLVLIITAHSYFHSYRKYEELNDSCKDAERLARYLHQNKLSSNVSLATDEGLFFGLQFYNYLTPFSKELHLVNKEQQLSLKNTYLAIGGSRPIWFSPEITLHLKNNEVPSSWREIKRFKAPLKPWRQSELRVYHIP